MFCPSCGAQLSDGANFCSSCGSKVGIPIEPEASQPRVAAEEAPAEQQAQATVEAAPAGQPQTVVAPVTVVPPQPVYVSPETTYPRKTNETLLQVAFIFNVITCVCWGCTLIGLAWAIPMTVHSYGVWKGKKPNTTAFGICTLLFLSLVGGILMLCADKDK